MKALARKEIFPSTLGIDTADLITQILGVHHAGAKTIHIDIMDGTLGSESYDGLLALKQLTESATLADLTFDCHVVSLEPDDILNALLALGGQAKLRVSVHIESEANMESWSGRFQSKDIPFGVAIFAAKTSLSKISPTFAPNFWHVFAADEDGKFSDKALSMIRELRCSGIGKPITIDGGVKLHLVEACYEAGADNLVVGSDIFKKEVPPEAFMKLLETLRRIAEEVTTLSEQNPKEAPDAFV